MDKITKVVKTKQTEDHDAVITTLTLDFTGLTTADVYEIAAQAAVIKWQGNARRMQVIPAVATYTVPKPGTRSAAVDYAGALVKLFGGDMAMVLIQKNGNSAEQAYLAIKPMLDAMMQKATTDPQEPTGEVETTDEVESEGDSI
jgi:hypothetical protein